MVAVRRDFRSWARQNAERRSTQIRARLLCRGAVEARREENLFRVRVEQHLLRVVGVPASRPGRARSIDAESVIAGALCLGQFVQAQELPNGPITLIVQSAAGGIVDVTARLYADVLARNLGRAVVVDNRPAGGGAAAAMAVKSAVPDGRTLLVYPGAQLVSLPQLQNVSYDPL